MVTVKVTCYHFVLHHPVLFHSDREKKRNRIENETEENRENNELVEPITFPCIPFYHECLLALTRPRPLASIGRMLISMYAVL